MVATDGRTDGGEFGGPRAGAGEPLTSPEWLAALPPLLFFSITATSAAPPGTRYPDFPPVFTILEPVLPLLRGPRF